MTVTAPTTAQRAVALWRPLSGALRHVENILVAFTFATITLITFANVVGRYVLSASIAFTTEVTVNLVVLLTMVGAAIAVRERAHLGFTLLHDTSRGYLRAAVSVLVTAAVCIFFAVLAWFGFDHAVQQLAGGRLTPALEIPQGLFTMALPLGAVLAIIRALEVGIADVSAALAEPDRVAAAAGGPSDHEDSPASDATTTEDRDG